MLTMIGAINEFERTNLLERQREGIEIAKRNGKYKGRCPVKIRILVSSTRSICGETLIRQS